MAPEMNDDFANCELSIEELEAIAAGWPSWARAIGRGLEDVWHAVESPTGKAVLNIGLAVVGIFALGSSANSLQKLGVNLQQN